MKISRGQLPFGVSLLIGFVIFILTFAKFSPTLTVGLDSGYTWALNHLFLNDYQTLTEILFPYGPLGFLKRPSAEGNNLFMAILFYSVLKFGFLLAVLRFKEFDRKLMTVLVAFVMSLFLNIDLIIIGVCAVLALKYLQRKSNFDIILISILAYVGFSIKSSIGIAAFSILFMALVFRTKNQGWKSITIPLITSIISILVTLIIIFHSPMPGINHFIDTIKMSGDYGSASLHPENNWLALSIFIISILLFPLVSNDRKSKIAYWILMPSLFLMWKHSMSRQDISHVFALFMFLFLFWGIILLYAKIHTLRILLLASISIGSYYSNTHQIPQFNEHKILTNGIHNFKHAVIDHKAYRDYCRKLSSKNLEENKLSHMVRKIVDTSTIDVYPWNLSYIPANDFNWQTRRTLQGGSYSVKLDKLTSAEFSKEDRPEFILQPLIQRQKQASYSSIDNKYLLNDYPFTTLEILNSYKIVVKEANYLLHKRRDTTILASPETITDFESSWDSWIEVPKDEESIIRMRVFSELTFFGRLIEFFFKTDALYVDYKLADESIVSYRYSRKQAMHGLWVNPLISFPNSQQKEQEVAKMRFRRLNPTIHKSKIKGEIETIKLVSSEAGVSSISQLLGKSDLPPTY